MKAGVRRSCSKLAAELTEPARRRHLGLVRPRGGRVRASTGSAGSPAPAPICSPPTSRSSAEPTDAEIEGGCNGTLRVEVRTRGARSHSARVVGRATTRSTRPRPILGPARRIPGRARSRSRASSTARASTPSASAAASPATSSPTSAWSPSTTASRPTRPAPRRRRYVRELFAGYDVDGHRPRRRRAARARRSARPGVRRRRRRARPGPSTAGRTSRASPPSASRPSTTARATRARARRRRARAGRADRAVRGGAAGVADRRLDGARRGARAALARRCPWWRQGHRDLRRLAHRHDRDLR